MNDQQDYANRLSVAVHEGGHAVAAQMSGLGANATASHGSGKTYVLNPMDIENHSARDARRDAVITCAGEAAELLIVPPHVRKLARLDRNTDGSDTERLVTLATLFGGSDPAGWIEAARQRAFTAVASACENVERAAAQLMEKGSIMNDDEPLYSAPYRPELFEAEFLTSRQLSQLRSRRQSNPRSQQVFHVRRQPEAATGQRIHGGIASVAMCGLNGRPW